MFNANFFQGFFGNECSDGKTQELVLTEAEVEINVAFQGVEGATSLKAELQGRIPVLNDASTFREARRLLTELGGAEALREELMFSGFVDPETHMLTTKDKPYNIFALLAAGKLRQHESFKDQEALGPFKNKFVICSNQRDADMHWDSKDPKWQSKASMSKRHRFLTTRDLHWQWFNPISFGMVPGGATPREAASEVEAMKLAALHYTKNVGGWTEQVGLYFSVFGHNNVNSLFMHVIDMAELGPSFRNNAHRICSFDDVIKVLREEAVQGLLPVAPTMRPIFLRPSMSNITVFHGGGAEGATSVKEEIVARVPRLMDASGYREARRLLTDEFGGFMTLKVELMRSRYVDPETNLLTTGTSPFNVFARVAAGVMKQPGMEKEQEYLGHFQDKFIICSNRPENDEHWDSEDPLWVGKASMSRRHRFLIKKDIHWQFFNPLVFGIVSEEEGGKNLGYVVEEVEMMKAAALTFAKEAGWSSKIGLFFHIFGHCSVNSLHLHILDMEELGPSFWKLEFKNCPIDAVLKVLREEHREALQEKTRSGSKDGVKVAQVAAQAAESAKEALDLMAETANRMSRRSRSSEDDTDPIIELNVGGEMVDVPISTLMIAPKGSYFKKIVDLYKKDFQSTQEKMFLNFPSRSFKILVDHLRLLSKAPPDCVIDPPVVEKWQQQELDDVAWLLGLSDYVLEAQEGHGVQEKTALGERPTIQSCLCCRRRRTKHS